MDYDTNKVDDMTLALLFLTTVVERNAAKIAWKGHDWTVMNRLHEKGYISDPKTKAKSVVLTPEGARRSEELFQKIFMPGEATPASGRASPPKQPRVYEFVVTLKKIQPPIWRCIQIPEIYTFWDLHVAIQDAMGWLDCHLHEFMIKDTLSRKFVNIGFPDEEFDDHIVIPSWECHIAAFFSLDNPSALYKYDFGDGWEHDIQLDNILPSQPNTRYPKCINGKRHWPPEDCGGVSGYEDLLQIIAAPSHEEHESMMIWLGGRFDPESFDPSRLRFTDPRKRLKKVFEP